MEFPLTPNEFLIDSPQSLLLPFSVDFLVVTLTYTSNKFLIPIGAFVMLSNYLRQNFKSSSRVLFSDKF